MENGKIYAPWNDRELTAVYEALGINGQMSAVDEIKRLRGSLQAMIDLARRVQLWSRADWAIIQRAERTLIQQTTEGMK